MFFIPSNKIIDYIISFMALYSMILFILIYLLNRNKFYDKTKKSNPDWIPSISVVIPSYNEEKNLPKCIESVLNIDYPSDKLEIIVVDDGSTDNSYNVASKYKNKGVLVFRKKNEGTAAATKNYGIKRASGELIATLDADSYVSRDIVKKLLPLFDEDVVVVTSAVKVANTGNFIQKIQQVEYLITLFSRKILSFIDAVFVTPGPFSLFRSEIFKKIGYFDEKSILEDQEIALRIQKHNLKIRSSLTANVFTETPKTFRSLLKQRIRWHRGGLINSINYLNLINPKYGDFGIIIMPLSLIAIFFIFLVFINTIYNIVFVPSIQDAFFISDFLLVLQPIHIIGLIILLITLSFSIHQLSFFKKEKLNPIWAVIFIVVYTYLITLYWLLAIWKQVKGDSISW